MHVVLQGVGCESERVNTKGNSKGDVGVQKLNVKESKHVLEENEENRITESDDAIFKA